MGKSNLVLKKELTDKFIYMLMDFFKEEDIMQIASGIVAFPTVDSEGNDRWVELKVVIPKGSNGEEFDGYEMANDYQIKVAEQIAKAEEKAKAKAKKIAEDEKRRKTKAEKSET